MSVHAYQAQQQVDLLSASPLELVRALYRGAIQSVRTARVALKAGEIRKRSEEITRAAAIVQELTLSLDRRIGGEFANNLIELYVYMHRRLGTANIEQSDEPLAEVERLLTILSEAWEQASDQDAAMPYRLTA